MTPFRKGTYRWLATERGPLHAFLERDGVLQDKYALCGLVFRDDRFATWAPDPERLRCKWCEMMLAQERNSKLQELP